MHVVFNWLREYSTVKNNYIDDKSLSEEDGDNKSNKNSLNFNNTNNRSNIVGNETLSVIDENNQSFISLSKILSGNNNNNSINSFEGNEESIAKIEQPNFNIFNLEKEVGSENVLVTISCYIIITLGLYNEINYNNFERSLFEISKGYKKTNFYHNDIHAADVEQTVFMYLRYGNIAEKLKLTNMDITALLISAIIHDYKHPGRTNQFLINTNHELAILYYGKYIYNIYFILIKNYYRSKCIRKLPHCRSF